MRNLEGGYQFHKNQIDQPNQHADCRRRSQRLELPTELPQSAGWLPAAVLPPTQRKLDMMVKIPCQTLLSLGIVLGSMPVILALHILATSRNFRPHSSVFVARNIHEAATS